MALHTYAPLVTQFTAEAPTKGSFLRYLSALFGRTGTFGERRIARSTGGQPDGLAMLEREADRIRLQSRHWLM